MQIFVSADVYNRELRTNKLSWTKTTFCLPLHEFFVFWQANLLYVYTLKFAFVVFCVTCWPVCQTVCLKGSGTNYMLRSMRVVCFGLWWMHCVSLWRWKWFGMFICFCAPMVCVWVHKPCATGRDIEQLRIYQINCLGACVCVVFLSMVIKLHAVVRLEVVWNIYLLLCTSL